MRVEDTPVIYPPLVYVPRPPKRVHTSHHRHVTYQGKKATLREWITLLGLGDDPHLLADRLYRYGWTVEEAMTPKRHLSFGKILVVVPEVGSGAGHLKGTIQVAKKKKWIQAANLNEGSFGAKAKKAGKGTQEYAAEEAGAPGKLGKQARLAKTFAKMAKKKK